jgi:hypothetical protein
MEDVLYQRQPFINPWKVATQGQETTNVCSIKKLGTSPLHIQKLLDCSQRTQGSQE